MQKPNRGTGGFILGVTRHRHTGRGQWLASVSCGIFPRLHFYFQVGLGLSETKGGEDGKCLIDWSKWLPASPGVDPLVVPEWDRLGVTRERKRKEKGEGK